jgi:hypothetical protein
MVAPFEGNGITHLRRVGLEVKVIRVNQFADDCLESIAHVGHLSWSNVMNGNIKVHWISSYNIVDG